MCFRTYLEAGGRYSQHKHNCQEITIKGHLIELDNNKIYEVGQTVIYDKEQCMNRIAQLKVSMM
jgi:anti-sigma factor ChrR (cupin superfamily)